MPRQKPPLDSFGPEIMAALLTGARKVVRMETTYRKGIYFRRRVHQLRARMKEEGHKMYPLAAKVRVSLTWGEEAGLPPVNETENSKRVRRPLKSDVPAILTLSPHDSEFNDALLKAGVSAEDLKDDVLSDDESVDDFLSNYTPKETTP